VHSPWRARLFSAHYPAKPIKIKEFMDTLNAALELTERTGAQAHATGQMA
jgi:hypothetical protein